MIQAFTKEKLIEKIQKSDRRFDVLAAFDKRTLARNGAKVFLALQSHQVFTQEIKKHTAEMRNFYEINDGSQEAYWNLDVDAKAVDTKTIIIFKDFWIRAFTQNGRTLEQSIQQNEVGVKDLSAIEVLEQKTRTQIQETNRQGCGTKIDKYVSTNSENTFDEELRQMVKMIQWNFTQNAYHMLMKVNIGYKLMGYGNDWAIPYSEKRMIIEQSPMGTGNPYGVAEYIKKHLPERVLCYYVESQFHVKTKTETRTE
ncbi:hypothetical protein BDK51DRAFT_28634 [Blyttiomyces helicus]|uniref:Uncharacterized protein n=1 Tax=Blyttiomyces helicus TaxID=388810 RepID=A0A4P9WJ36_9FUNG|nr:hypothetical protein BDK51DRAFT_28634 [Blyttiomyces helicus]|eukprot:RKO92834.1 hypothetical protein BDK51DRAFT_28634 [Blyttiomyces helicus]